MLLERYREFLPIGERTPMLTLSEGDTPLVAAPRLAAIVVVPSGKIALGKLAQALMYGARLLVIDGNFDQALQTVRDLAERYPVTLVNSVNPFRIEGQTTAAYEVCDALGGPPDALCLPVGNAGNISAYWMGFKRYADAGKISARPKRRPMLAAGRRARPPGPRRSSVARRSSTPRPSRPRSGSATRPAGAAPSPRATSRAA